MPRTLICGAMPFGYGPAAKLLVIARALKDRGLSLVFIGRGIALELASRSAKMFDEVLTAQSPHGVRAAVERAAAVLSVMDRELAQAATVSGAPLYVVDSLLWMRDAVPPAFRDACRYWAQDFLGLREIQGDYQPAPSIVGPIVSLEAGRRDTAAEHLLVNLGGCEAPDGADANVRAYADFVVGGFLGSPLAERFAGRSTVIAGVRCIEALQARYAGHDVEFVSLSHEAALERLARASLVMTSPGLTMMLESFQHGVPTFFLPPQNYSQWCTLRLLRDAGLAPHALHWEDLSPTLRLRDRMPESERNPVVRTAIASFTAETGARARFDRCLAEVDRFDHTVLGDRQQRFFGSLGRNGAPTIADQIADDLQFPQNRADLAPSRHRSGEAAE